MEDGLYGDWKPFSERHGISSVKDKIQHEHVDKHLRIGLWNVFYECYFKRMSKILPMLNHPLLGATGDHANFIKKLWANAMKKPIDSIVWDANELGNDIKKYLFECDWGEVYDFIEYAANYYPNQGNNRRFIEECNLILKKELSAYRFVGNKIVQITSDKEIDAIEEAIEAAKPLSTVYTHLDTALEMLADRKNPDYRNSMKESISAVESLCTRIIGEKKTLTQAINHIEQQGKIELNENLKGALKKLYWYTSDDDGIRHCLTDEPKVDFEDAKFMLVSCSAFVYYLIEKSAKANIDLED